MVPSPEFVKSFEMEYLKLISLLLKTGGIDMKTSQESARYLLTLLPFASYDDMQEKVKNLTDKYKQLEKLYIFFLATREEDKTGQVLEKMRILMKNNNIEEALHLAKK